MIYSDGSTRPEPRYFGRRVLGFLLDVLIAQLVAMLLFYAMSAATGISLGGSASEHSECGPAPINHAQVLRLDAMWPLPTHTTRENTICRFGEGANESRLFTTKMISTDGTTTFTRTVSYPVDNDGKALPVDYDYDLTVFVVILFFVLFAAAGLRTPGKMVMGLKILTEAGTRPSPGQAVIREILRLLPLLSYGLIMLWVVFGKPAMLTESEVIIRQMRDAALFAAPPVAIATGLSVATLIWWLGPLLIWRGRSWHDRLVGTRLTRTDVPPATAQRPA